MTVTDRITEVEVDLLPGGGSVGPGPLKLPVPKSLSSEPAIASLKTLLEIKLSSYIGLPVTRLRDLGDVVELIKANDLPRNYDLVAAVCGKYIEVWDGLEAERLRSARSRLLKAGTVIAASSRQVSISSSSHPPQQERSLQYAP